MIVLKTLAQRALYARKKLKLEPADVAKLIPMSLQGYLDIESGKTSLPRNFARIAEIYRVTPQWLLLGAGKNPYAETGEMMVPEGNVPLLEWKEAVHGICAITLKDKKVVIPMRNKGSDGCFALQIKDNSMMSSIIGEQTFLPGDYIIVDPEKIPQDKDFVVAIQKDSVEPVFKQYLVEGKDITLSPLNPRYQSIKLDENIKICGVVIEKYTSFHTEK